MFKTQGDAITYCEKFGYTPRPNDALEIAEALHRAFMAGRGGAVEQANQRDRQSNFINVGGLPSPFGVPGAPDDYFVSRLGHEQVARVVKNRKIK